MGMYLNVEGKTTYKITGIIYDAFTAVLGEGFDEAGDLDVITATQLVMHIANQLNIGIHIEQLKDLAAVANAAELAYKLGVWTSQSEREPIYWA